MTKRKCTLILLAAGSGKRMNSKVPKQFMELNGKPLIWYPLHTVEQSEIIEDCILVTGKDEIPYVQQEIVEKYGFRKVSAVVAGGAERYASVQNALWTLEARGDALTDNGIVFVQDGARPFLTEQMLSDLYECACRDGACVAAVPAKDTIKIVDEENFAKETPNRKYLWNVQTPQVFDMQLFLTANHRMQEQIPEVESGRIAITDDASVVEFFTDEKVKMVMGSYNNIKVTTPEDMIIAQAILNSICKS